MHCWQERLVFHLKHYSIGQNKTQARRMLLLHSVAPSAFKLVKEMKGRKVERPTLGMMSGKYRYCEHPMWSSCRHHQQHAYYSGCFPAASSNNADGFVGRHNVYHFIFFLILKTTHQHNPCHLTHCFQRK